MTTEKPDSELVIDAFMVRNETVNRTISKFIPSTDVSMSAVCRKLPYLLMELGHATNSLWTASCSLTEDKIILSCYSSTTPNGEFPVCNFKLTKPYTGGGTSLSKALCGIARRPIKRIAVPAKYGSNEPFQVLSNYGKGLFTVSVHEDNSILFTFCYLPLHPSLSERLWVTWTNIRRFFRAKGKGSTDVKYCICLSPHAHLAPPASRVS